MANTKEPVTLKTLAQILGLTPSTISKALRDSSDIAVKTRQVVKSKAKELGYQPNIMARSLIRRKTHMIGVIVPDLRVSFFTEVAQGIYDQAESLDYEAIVMVHDESSKSERRNLEFLSALNVDGILISPVPGKKNIPTIEQILNRGIPFTCFDRLVDGLELPSVTIDDAKSTSEIIDHLVSNGRKNILFIGPMRNFHVTRGRYHGYRNSLRTHNIRYRPELMLQCKINANDAYNQVKKTIHNGVNFNAVICIGGLVAYGAGKAILDSGRRIPHDVMLAEFGDNHVVYRLGVPFVTVNQFPYQMGQQAVKTILKIIDSDSTNPTPGTAIIDTQLLFHNFTY